MAKAINVLSPFQKSLCPFRKILRYYHFFNYNLFEFSFVYIFYILCVQGSSPAAAIIVTDTPDKSTLI